MPWARFTQKFTWPKRGPWHRDYQPGQEHNLTREVLKAAEAEGAVERIPAPPRPKRDA